MWEELKRFDMGTIFGRTSNEITKKKKKKSASCIGLTKSRDSNEIMYSVSSRVNGANSELWE